ncbi:MAG TPA: hypothetical protein EYP68_06375 [Candidatus Korarchaeota archaeon]|nr:hypothetical protein [Candidatus Korarchaeota archaeon]
MKALGSDRKFTLRAIAIGLFFAALTTVLNAYLGINFGMGFGFGVVTIIISYAILHKMLGGSSRGELGVAYIISTSTLVAHWILGLSIFLAERYSDVTFPSWLYPPNTDPSLGFRIWLKPVLVLFSLELIATCLGLFFSVLLSDEFLKSEKMIFPNYAASASLIDACIKGGGEARLVGISALAGFLITLVQYSLSALGINLVNINLTPYLPKGAVFAISLSLGFAAIGYIISAQVSLSLLLSGLLTYLIFAPYLVSRNIVEYSENMQEFYNNMIFGFSISPAIGMLILGGFVLSILLFLRRIIGKKEEESAKESIGYVYLYKAFWKKLLRNKKLSLTFFFLLSILLGAAYILNPFYPLPRWFSVSFAAYASFFASFIEIVILTKMSGETGMSMGTTGIILYDVPVFTVGYRGYAGYMAAPYFRPNPWTAPSITGLVKYKDSMDVSVKDIVKAKIIGWLPTFALSAFVTIALWRYLGFGNEQMPAAGLLQSSIYVRMLATGNIRGTVDPTLFFAGGVMGAMLEVATPLSMTGLAMGMILPPNYIVPIALGGFARLITDRKLGRKWYKERGMLIATGLLASSIITQVIMTILMTI